MSFRFRFTVLFILSRLLVSNFIFMGGRFGSSVLVVKLKSNRTGKISGFSNRFFISIRFFRLISIGFLGFFSYSVFLNTPSYNIYGIIFVSLKVSTMIWHFVCLLNLLAVLMGSIELYVMINHEELFNWFLDFMIVSISLTVFNVTI
jgi:hypothetical protein